MDTRRHPVPVRLRSMGHDEGPRRRRRASTRRPGRPPNVDRRARPRRDPRPPARRAAALAPCPDRRRRRGARARGRPAARSSPGSARPGSANGPAMTPGSMRWTPAWLDQTRGRRQPVAGARPRRQPRHPAPIRGGRPADGRRSLAGRPRHGRLRGIARPRRPVSRLMDLVAGEAPTILMVIGLDDLDGARRPARFTAHLALGQRPRPDLAGPLRRGGADRDRRATSRSTSSTRGSSSTDPTTPRATRSSGSTRPGSRTVARLIGPRHRRDRRTLDRPRRGRARRAAARGEALDPRPRRPGRRVLPRGRPARRTCSSPGRSVSASDARRSTRRSRPTSRLWDAWTAIHAEGEFYDLEGVQGRRRPAPPVRDRDDRRRRRPDAPPPPVPLRDRHPVVRAARGAGHRRRPVARGGRAGAVAGRRARLPRGPLRPVQPVRPADVLDGRFDIVYTSRGVLDWLPDIAAWARRRGPLPGPGRDVLHHRGPPGHERLRERRRRARRAPPRLPVLGACRAADVRGQRLVRRPGRGRPRAGRARAGITAWARS